MSELNINLAKLKQIAVFWKRKHAAIESIRLVYATHYLSDHKYYKAILIAIVPTPDDDYLDWVKDPGASHIRNEVEQFGLEEVMWLTCENMAEAEEWVVDLTESRTIRDKGVGSSIRFGRTTSITSAGRIKIKSPPFYKSGEELKAIIVRAPSITSAAGADIVWVNLTDIPERKQAQKSTVNAKRMAEQKDKEKARESALEYIKGCKNNSEIPRIYKAVKMIKDKGLSRVYQDKKTIPNWIRDLFPAESRIEGQGRPKKE